VSPRVVPALLLVAALVGSSAPLAHAAPATTAPLAWRSCGNRFECATLDVPVDYSASSGDQVGIAVIRRPATDPAARIGSLVINYGGPGDPGTETLRAAYQSIPSEIRQRFDLVSFDPRGTGKSRPIDCVDDATYERAASEDATPNSDADLAKFYDGSAFSVDLIGACIFRNGTWLARVGTRNVARDLDRLRAALGDSQLTFLGYSYGTVIGAVYAQTFPKHVRALVLDSAVNLSTSAQERQEGNARGFEEALDAFLADCAADTGCPFHAGGDPQATLLRLRDEFEGGLILPTHDGRTVGVTEFYVGMLGALYARETWITLAEALREADEDANGDGLRRLTDRLLGRRDDGTYDNLQEAIGIINCADDPSKRVSFTEFRRTYTELVQRYPVFGRPFGGSPVGCDPRLPVPSASEQLGDVRSDDAPPVLVVGITHDPVTPYAGAKVLHQRLRASRLLTLDGTQHTAYGRGIACVDSAVDQYLLERVLPLPRARCER
jgi:pimeloyl-ACP methyl ester carboxylesterase